jgi:hypothetical protein
VKAVNIAGRIGIKELFDAGIQTPGLGMHKHQTGRTKNRNHVLIASYSILEIKQFKHSIPPDI